MIININVPTKTLSPTTPAGRYTGPEYITQLPEFTPSKVDRLRYGPSGGLTGVVSRTTGFVFGGSENVNAISLRRRTMRIAESIALHMPTPLLYNTHNAYEEISLTALGARLGVTGLTAITSAVVAASGRSLNTAIETARGASRVFNALGQIVSTGAKLMQSPINPAVEILFSNTLVRQFTLEVMMAPRNEKESISMKDIIKTLRFHAAPEISDTLAGLFWIPPAEFDITFFNKGVENMNILRMNTCVLERIEVDYSPTGVYSTFRNGHPVAARLSMGFRELEPIHKKRVLQGF